MSILVAGSNFKQWRNRFILKKRLRLKNRLATTLILSVCLNCLQTILFSCSLLGFSRMGTEPHSVPTQLFPLWALDT